MESEICLWVRSVMCRVFTASTEAWLWRVMVVTFAATFFSAGWFLGWVFNQWRTNNSSKPLLAVIIATVTASLIIVVREVLLWPNDKSSGTRDQPT